MKKTDQPLSGEAAWNAAKEETRKRNDAAHARARKQRGVKDAESAARGLAADRREMANLPQQPTPGR